MPFLQHAHSREEKTLPSENRNRYVPYFTLAEQRRRGPNIVGYMGLLQPLAVDLKRFVKYIVLLTNATAHSVFVGKSYPVELVQPRDRLSTLVG